MRPFSSLTLSPLLAVVIFHALMTGLTICHVLRKYPSASRHITVQWCTKVSAYVVVFSVVRISSLLNRGGQLFEREVARFPIDPAPTNRTTTFWCAHRSLLIQPRPAGAGLA